MKLFLVLLIVGLSSSEKLNRAYLPPSGAKFSGGNSADLQTPLEYPEETQIWSGNKARLGDVETQNYELKNRFPNAFDTDSYKTEETRDKYSSKYTPGNPDDYTQSFETINPIFGLDIENTQNIIANVKYPIEHKGMDYFGNGGYHYGKPGNMPIIALTENIMPNYQPKAFGMYGGSPMIIKTYTKTPHQAQSNDKYINHNGKYLINSPDDLLEYSSNEGYNGIQKSGHGSDPTMYRPAAISQVNQIKKFYYKRPERVQAESDRSAVILDYNNVLTPDRYSYDFDTSNGIHKDESATTVNGVKALGSYSYTGDDGKVYSVTYSADERGFQPKGEHLPTPPPIPEAIQKVIEQAKKDKESGIYHDGSYDEEKYGYMKYQGPINRYIQNMQDNSKLNMRNRVINFKNTKPALKKDIISKENKIEEINIQQNKNVNAFNHPVNDLNGQFGMRKVKVKQINSVNKLNGENKNYRQPVSSIVLRKPSTSITKNDLLSNIAISNKEVPSRKQYQGSINIKNNNVNIKNMNIPQDAGYYYVPPSKIFAEGRFQDKPTGFEPLNQLIKTYNEDVGKKSTLGTGLYFVDQRNNYNTFHKETNAEKPANIDITDENYFYKSTTQDISQYTNDFDTSTTPSSTFVMSTHTFNGDTLSTNDYDQDYTEGIVRQEETMVPEQKDENGIPPTKYYKLDMDKASTTPMPSEEKQTTDKGNPNQYKKKPSQTGVDIPSKQANYLEPEGYFRTTPEVPANFEDFPSEIYTPISTVSGVQTESIANVKVDGFGRPIPDNSQLFNANKDSFALVTTITPLQEEDTDASVKATATFFNFEEQLTDKAIPDYNESVTVVSGYGKSSEREKSTSYIGEDFSGPKQPQRYDPRTGYYY